MGSSEDSRHVVGIQDGKVSHEHIYWEQAGVLVQIGLLDPRGLPVVGAEAVRKVHDPGRTLWGPARTA